MEWTCVECGKVEPVRQYFDRHGAQVAYLEPRDWITGYQQSQGRSIRVCSSSCMFTHISKAQAGTKQEPTRGTTLADMHATLNRKRRKA